MNIYSPKLRFTKKQRPYFIAPLLVSLCMFAGLRPLRAGTTISIVDTLGDATPATQFSVGGTSGSIIGPVFLGPKFTLTQPTTLTEIGGFLNNCRSFFLGVPQCPKTLPFVLQIRPTINGFLDPSTILGSFVMSHDDNPFIVSYESVALNFTLPPGTYFAVFGPQSDDQGFLLAGASNPFEYRAGVVDIGVFIPPIGGSFRPQEFAAVRILGERNVFIGACDSGVPDLTLPGGSTISDLIAECSDSATNHGRFVSCVSHVTNDLRSAGTITPQQKSAIQRCAASG